MTASRAATGRRPDVEAELKDKYHVEFTFARKVPTDDFDTDKSLHNQARFEPIDEDTVEQYKEAVERGDAFPAVLAYRPGRAANAKLVIIDGNHRLVAHQRADKPIDVYEIDRGTNAKQIALMTFAFNTRHGRATSEKEREAQAIYLINNGASQEAAAEAVNLPMRILKRALAKAKADARADEVGVDRREWDGLSQSIKSRLLNVTTDEGFHGAVHLTYAAKLNADEVFDLVTLLNTSKSARKQRDIINNETSRYSDRIGDNAGGVLTTADRRQMTPKSRVGMVLGQVLALPEDMNALVRSYAANEREDAGSKVMDASERLRKLALELNPALK